MLYMDTMTVYADPVPFNFTDVTNDDFFNGDYSFTDNSMNEQYDHLKAVTRLIENDNYKPEISRDRDVNREKIVSEDTVNTPLPSPQEKLKLNHQEVLNKIKVLREEKNNLEKSYEWKFLTDPEKNPCNYQWVFKSPDLNITANVKFSSIQDRDRLLSDDFDDSPINIPKLNFFDPKPFYNAIERNAELSARNYLLATQERHIRLTKEIQSNENELRNIKISIEKSSILTMPIPIIPVHNGGSVSDEKTRMDANFAQAIENKLNAVGDKLAETFECTFGFACASDLDKTAKNPNLGKDLSNSDKVELGGTGSGGADGWEPENENSSGSTNKVFSSIKDSPQYPNGFRSTQNGTTRNIVNNKRALEDFRKIESGKWHKVYKDGYDLAGNKVSIHYFQSQSGRVINVKVKPGWSNI